MFCTKCGSEVSGDSKFCTTCGAEIDAHETAQQVNGGFETTRIYNQANDNLAQTSVAQNVVPGNPVITKAAPSSSKKGIVIGIIIGLVIVAAVAGLVVYFMTGNQQMQQVQSVQQQQSTQNDVAGNNQSVDTSKQEEVGASEPSFKSQCFEVFLPENLANTISFAEKNNTVILTYTPSNTIIATLYPQGEKLEDESANKSYILGEVYIGGHYENAIAQFFYVEANGTIAHWSSKSHLELSVEKVLGLSCEEFLKYVFISTGSEYVECTPALQSDHAEWVKSDSKSGSSSSEKSDSSKNKKDSSYASSNKPFWGIWVGASKSKSEMEKLLKNLKNKGLKNAVLVKTSNWSNLNSQTWWVVSAGKYESKKAANKALSKVKKKGYSDAYVKYTGSKR